MSKNVEYAERGTLYLAPIRGQDVVRIQIEISPGVVITRAQEWKEAGGSKETTVIIAVEVAG